ncbi:MAG TPA: cupin domain-containing protein [Chloroflexota bacterium]|jgi:mannose-6-phosphate isomerase-like protein (cupin superfamily)
MPAEVDPTPVVIDLAALAREPLARQPAWALQSTDLNANLLVFDGVDGVAEHVNNEVDVLVVVVAGTGIVSIAGTDHRLGAGQAMLVPVGARRAIHAGGTRFAYLTCHRRRAGLWPDGVTRPR